MTHGHTIVKPRHGVSNWQTAYDNSLEYEGDSFGLRSHLITEHLVINPPVAGYTQGEWSNLANIHAKNHAHPIKENNMEAKKNGVWLLFNNFGDLLSAHESELNALRALADSQGLGVSREGEHVSFLEFGKSHV